MSSIGYHILVLRFLPSKVKISTIINLIKIAINQGDVHLDYVKVIQGTLDSLKYWQYLFKTQFLFKTLPKKLSPLCLRK